MESSSWDEARPQAKRGPNPEEEGQSSQPGCIGKQKQGHEKSTNVLCFELTKTYYKFKETFAVETFLHEKKREKICSRKSWWERKAKAASYFPDNFLKGKEESNNLIFLLLGIKSGQGKNLQKQQRILYSARSTTTRQRKKEEGVGRKDP